MINKITYTTEWQEKTLTYTKQKNLVLEKVTYALSLLELISNSNVEFVFKGGTSLMLLLDKLNRFSVDIDILVLESNLEEFIDGIDIKDTIFTSFKEDFRTYRGIKKRHFKFFYKSNLDQTEQYVILDIVYEPIAYQNYTTKKIDFDFINTQKPYNEIKIPVVEEILGDKLTAFAPNTIGVKYADEKYTEIIKQLFDVSILSKNSSSLNMVLETYKTISAHEIILRKLPKITYMDCIEDSLEALRVLLSNGNYGNKSNFLSLQRGIRGFNNFLTERFTINSVFQHAANVYILYVKLKVGSILEYNKLIKGIKNESMKNTFIKSSYRLLKTQTDNYDELESAIRLNEFQL